MQLREMGAKEAEVVFDALAAIALVEKPPKCQ